MILLVFLSVFTLGASKSDTFEEYPYNSEDETSAPYAAPMLFTKYENDLDNNEVVTLRTTKTLGVQDLYDLRAVLKQVLPNLEEDITLAPKEDLTFSVIYNQLESTEPSKDQEDRTMYVYPIYSASRTADPRKSTTAHVSKVSTAEVINKEEHVHLAEDPEGNAIFRGQSDKEVNKTKNKTNFENKTKSNSENEKQTPIKENVINSAVAKKVIEKLESVPQDSNELVFDFDNNRFLTDAQEDGRNDKSKKIEVFDFNNNKFLAEDKNNSRKDKDDHRIIVELKKKVGIKQDDNKAKSDIYKKTDYKINNTSNDVLNKSETTQYNLDDNKIYIKDDDFLDNDKKRVVNSDTQAENEIDHNEKAKTDTDEIKMEESNIEPKLIDTNDISIENGEIIYTDDKINETDDNLAKENVIVLSDKSETNEKVHKLEPVRKDVELSNYGVNDGYGNLNEVADESLSISNDTKKESTVIYHYYEDDGEKFNDLHFKTNRTQEEFDKYLIEYGLTNPTRTVTRTEQNNASYLGLRNKPRRRKTTLPRIDMALLMNYIKNLTADYKNDLANKLEQSLEKYSFPTCGEPTTTTEIPITTTVVTTERMSNITGTIMGKCFVCGLDVRGIPLTAPCSDAFAPDVIPLLPVNPTSRAHIAQYRKYCRYMDIPHYHLNTTEPKNLWGRWTGGCSVRWIDVSGIYTQRSCRNRNNAIRGRHFVSRRMSMLEMALQSVDNGCIISPMASLVPLSRGISLFARFHACVCTGSWCNRATRTMKLSPFVLLFLLVGYL